MRAWVRLLGVWSSRCRWAAVVAGLLVALMLAMGWAGSAKAAEGGPTMEISLVNHLNADVTLVAKRNDCWYPRELDHPLDKMFAAPNTTFTYRTGKNNLFFGPCHNKSGAVAVDLKVRERGGDWYVPAGSPGDFRLTWQPDVFANSYGLQVHDALQTWVPRHDGHGLVCWTAGKPRLNSFSPDAFAAVNIFVESTAATCNRLRPADYTTGVHQCGIFGGTCNDLARLPEPAAASPSAASPSAARAPAPTSAVRGADSVAANGDTGKIVDLLSTVAVACPWYVYPGDIKRCDSLDVGKEANWTLRNLTTDVRDFKITGVVGTDDPKSAVATAQVSIPKTSPAGTLTASNTVMTGTSTVNGTTNGGKISLALGFKQSGKIGLPLVAEGGVEFSQTLTGEWNYNTNTATTTTDSLTRAVSISAGAAPGYTTTLDVFTVKRSAKYLYSADLEFGKPDAVESVLTPAEAALDQSPTGLQPCLGYIVGDKRVRNSLTYIGQQLLDAGNSPTDPALPADRAAFLGSMPVFYTKGTCPGFPAGFASAAGFKGDGVGTYENFGYGADGKPVQVFTGCVYQAPFPAGSDQGLLRPTSDRRLLNRLRHSRPAPATARTQATGHAATDNKGPCQDVPAGGNINAVKPGALIDDRLGTGASGVRTSAGGGRARALVAPDESVKILGPQHGGTIYTNNGANDIVDAGRGNTKVIGGAGENLINGGPGHDTLIGGHGAMNYLNAGNGNNTLIESDGQAEMQGGPGTTTFEGHDMAGVMAGGSGGSEMIATGHLSHLQIKGGTAANTYVLRGTGTPTIVQSPSRRPSLLEINHSIVIPAYVDDAKALGRRPVTLTGNLGTESLTANAGADTLIAGPGPERLHGGTGRDTIIFNAYNDDVATGGSGPDMYRFTGSPELVQRPAALADPADRTAAQITNFNPAKGDRLILSARVFGKALLKLRDGGYQIAAGANPRPRNDRPTLLLNTCDHVLSFDADGSGPISDKVIAKLPTGLDTVRPAWVQITR